MSKLGIWLPRSISRAISTQREDSPEPFHVREHAEDAAEEIDEGLRRRTGANSSTASDLLPRVRRIGRNVIRSNPSSQTHSRATSQGPIPLSGVTTTTESSGQDSKESDRLSTKEPPQYPAEDPSSINPPQPVQLSQRAIRFPDEVDLPQAASGAKS